MEERYLSRFNSFFNSEKLSSTYKPVFVKSLVDISDYDEHKPQRLIGQEQWVRKEKDDKLRIGLDFIAIRYIQYYWELYFKFKLKQSHSPKDANINRILRNLLDWHDPKTPTLNSLASDDFYVLRREIIRNSIKPEVLIHLDPQQVLYERILHKDYILINYSIVHFFRKYREILIAAINYMITRYLEKINFVPRIAEKVSGNIPRNYLTGAEKKIILALHDSCFYCGTKPDDQYYYMDHVIPFNFIFQTEIFNIVPACLACNSRKSDRLPTQEIFNKVKQRNRQLSLRPDYTEDWYQKLYDSCVTSYHGNKAYFNTY